MMQRRKKTGLSEAPIRRQRKSYRGSFYPPCKSRFPLLFSHSSSKGSSMSTSSTTPSSGYRKGIRERIMDCISSQDTSNDAHQMLADEDTDNRESDTSFLRELTRTPLSKVWNQYRHKKWGQDPSLPPLEELESQLIQMVPSYCA